MKLHLTAQEMGENGFPPLGLRLEGDDFAWSLFPEPGTVASVEGPIGGLPCLHLRIVEGAVRDEASLAKLAEAPFGGELVAPSLEPGTSGTLELAGARRPALAFYGRRRQGASVACCVAAIPAGDVTLLVIAGVLGTRRTRPSPASVVANPPLAILLESLELETEALVPRLMPE